MIQEAFSQLVKKSLEPEVQKRAITYLAEHLGKFLNPGERVVICFPEHKEGNLGWLMEQAALQIKAVPVIWSEDHLWNSLLRQTFTSHASAVIGPPLIILGLMKLKKHHNTPLPIRKVITAGYPCLDWMIDGIAKGLDCEVGGCFSLGDVGVVAGFACGRSWGVHLREEEYGVDIVDEFGNVLPDGQIGQIALYHKDQPQYRYPMGEFARIVSEPCDCGSGTVRLLDMQPGKLKDADLLELSQSLHSWTSILDCKVERGEYGLEIEMVVFAGEKLPKMPNAAKMIIRPFNPKTEKPFWYIPSVKNAWK